MREDEEAATAMLEDRRDDAPRIGPEPDSVDETGADSFPASDPPSKTPITRIGGPCHAVGTGQR